MIIKKKNSSTSGLWAIFTFPWWVWLLTACTWQFWCRNLKRWCSRKKKKIHQIVAVYFKTLKNINKIVILLGKESPSWEPYFETVTLFCWICHWEWRGNVFFCGNFIWQNVGDFCRIGICGIWSSRLEFQTGTRAKSVWSKMLLGWNLD